MNKNNAQGALEYLLLIGGAVLIAAIVITLIAGIGQQGSTTGATRASDAFCAPFISPTECESRLADQTGDALSDCTWEASLSKCVARLVSSLACNELREDECLLEYGCVENKLTGACIEFENAGCNSLPEEVCNDRPELNGQTCRWSILPSGEGACATFISLKCIGSDEVACVADAACQWEPIAGRCHVNTCSELADDEATCNNVATENCVWSGVRCEQVFEVDPCIVIGQDEATCRNTAACQWGGTEGCFPRGVCAGLNEGVCTPNPNCHWNGQDCQLGGFCNALTQDQCAIYIPTEICEWDAAGGQCNPVDQPSNDQGGVAIPDPAAGETCADFENNANGCNNLRDAENNPACNYLSSIGNCADQGTVNLNTFCQKQNPEVCIEANSLDYDGDGTGDCQFDSIINKCITIDAELKTCNFHNGDQLKCEDHADACAWNNADQTCSEIGVAFNCNDVAKENCGNFPDKCFAQKSDIGKVIACQNIGDFGSDACVGLNAPTCAEADHACVVVNGTTCFGIGDPNICESIVNIGECNNTNGCAYNALNRRCSPVGLGQNVPCQQLTIKAECQAQAGVCTWSGNLCIPFT